MRRRRWWIHTEQIRCIPNLRLITEHSDDTDHLIIEINRHIVALTCSRILRQILFSNQHRLSRRQHLCGPLMKGTNAILFRRRDDDRVRIHDIDRAMPHQR